LADAGWAAVIDQRRAGAGGGRGARADRVLRHEGAAGPDEDTGRSVPRAGRGDRHPRVQAAERGCGHGGGSLAGALNHRAADGERGTGGSGSWGGGRGGDGVRGGGGGGETGGTRTGAAEIFGRSDPSNNQVLVRAPEKYQGDVAQHLVVRGVRQHENVRGPGE